MRFTISEEQKQAKSAAREFFDSITSIESVAAQLDGDDGVAAELWDELARLDYPAITIPIEHGGLGDDVLTATLLLEEAGRFALPGPFPETIAFAVPLLTELGTEEQKKEHFDRILNGDLRMSFALYEDGAEPLPQGVQLRAERTDDGYRLNGTKSLVPYGDSVERVILAARTRPDRGSDGISLFVVDPDEAAVERQDSLDRTRPLCRLAFDDVEVPESARLCPRHDAGPALERALDRYRTGVCGMLVGGADRVVDLSVQHAKEREQFGHPIGRYQAVKHRIADMWMSVQASRSLVYYAAWALSDDDPDAPRAASAAKSFCGDRLAPLMGQDIQNQGAMGTTWDHDTHIYLKQAKAFENFLGSPQQHRERIADIRGL